MKKKIKRITKKEIKDYNVLGSSVGESFGLCMYLAHKYCSNFRERVAAFRLLKKDRMKRIMEGVSGKEFDVVDFYEKINKFPVKEIRNVKKGKISDN